MQHVTGVLIQQADWEGIGREDGPRIRGNKGGGGRFANRSYQNVLTLSEGRGWLEKLGYAARM